MFSTGIALSRAMASSIVRLFWATSFNSSRMVVSSHIACVLIVHEGTSSGAGNRPSNLPFKWKCFACIGIQFPGADSDPLHARRKLCERKCSPPLYGDRIFILGLIRIRDEPHIGDRKNDGDTRVIVTGEEDGVGRLRCTGTHR